MKRLVPLVMQFLIKDFLVNTVSASHLVPRRVRVWLLNRLGCHIHPSSQIYSGCFLGGGRGLTVERNVIINHNCFLDMCAPITLGEGTGLGYETMIVTATHEPGDAARRFGPLAFRPVTVGRGVWVGARVTILPGVTIGDGCVIAAGSVVSSDCMPNGFYAGVPAVRKKDLD